ncbi:MAG TPA: hypothetical protein VFH95_14310 [Candidatus Kapabacteria bacterium]|nr:hypothetical protein [Candidatus Kapabacteria bacterium]
MAKTMKKVFDAVEWVRSVRDANYKRLGHLPPKVSAVFPKRAGTPR